MNQIIDTHCHLDFEQFDSDRNNVISRARDQGITSIIVPAVDLDGCRRVIKMAEEYDMVYGAVGIHPNSTAAWDRAWIDRIRELAKNDKIVAVGEIGLDYFRSHSPRKKQRQAFGSHLELAAELKLPVIIHNREAGEDVLKMLEESPLVSQEKKGVLHSFSADLDIANRAIEMGYYLGFTGPVTYKNAHLLRSIAREIPADRILIETDGPFLAPQFRRGKRNEPASNR